MREGTDSSQETRLRLLLEDNGYTNPHVNYKISDAISGRWVLADIAFPRQKVAIEYDGRYHDTQIRKDRHRERFLNQLGWAVISVGAEDLAEEWSRRELLASVAAKLDVLPQDTRTAS